MAGEGASTEYLEAEFEFVLVFDFELFPVPLERERECDVKFSIGEEAIGVVFARWTGVVTVRR